MFCSNFFLEGLLGQNTNDTGNKIIECNSIGMAYKRSEETSD